MARSWRCVWGAAVVITVTSALLAGAWLKRVLFFQAAASWALCLDVTLAGIDVDWAPSGQTLHILLKGLLVSPPGQSSADPPLANISQMWVQLEHTGRLRFHSAATISGLQIHFVAYDPSFTDTNVRRALHALGGDIAAAEGGLATGATTAADSPSSVTFTSVSLSHMSVLPEIRQGTHRAVLPPITLLDEMLDVRLLEAGLSAALINFASALVFRTLASTSIDSLRSLSREPAASLREKSKTSCV